MDYHGEWVIKQSDLEITSSVDYEIIYSAPDPLKFWDAPLSDYYLAPDILMNAV